MLSIRRWWNGEVPTPVVGDNVVIFMTSPQRHWTARAAHGVVAFIRRDWKWIVGTLLAVTALLIAARKS